MDATRPRWLRVSIRIVLWTAAVIVGLIALLALSVPLARIGSRGRLDAVTNVTIPGVGGPDVKAYVARPTGPGPHPAVIMVHEFWGLREDIARKADLLAEEGYVVVAPDVFRGSTTSWIPRAIYQVTSTPAEQINTDLDSVNAWLGTQPDVDAARTAIVGFCFGGRSAMLYSLHNPKLKGTVVFYGNPPLDAERLRALQGPVLGIFGGADQSIPLADVASFERALQQANVESTVTVYPDQPHAFIETVDTIKAGGVQGQAWSQMIRFLEGALAARPAPSSSGSPQAASDRIGWSYALRIGMSHLMGHSSHQ